MWHFWVVHNYRTVKKIKCQKVKPGLMVRKKTFATSLKKSHNIFLIYRLFWYLVLFSDASWARTMTWQSRTVEPETKTNVSATQGKSHDPSPKWKSGSALKSLSPRARVWSGTVWGSTPGAKLWESATPIKPRASHVSAPKTYATGQSQPLLLPNQLKLCYWPSSFLHLINCSCERKETCR